MGCRPSADLFFGYYLSADDHDFEGEGIPDEFENDSVVVECVGFEFGDRMVYIQGTHVSADWNGVQDAGLADPSEKQIRNLVKACKAQNIPTEVDPKWILCASYN